MPDPYILPASDTIAAVLMVVGLVSLAAGYLIRSKR